MQYIKKTIVFLITATALVVCYVVVVGAFFRSPNSDISVPNTHDVSAATISNNAPVLLTIPALAIQSNIQQVGVTRSGKMAVPSNFTDVGWYKYGTLPGQVGSAVIAGHVDDGLAFPAVFSKLSQLHPGDDIYVTSKAGQTLHFVVVGSQAYSKDAVATDVFNDRSGRLLKLITCTGNWLPSLRTHDQRLVVTAELV